MHDVNRILFDRENAEIKRLDEEIISSFAETYSAEVNPAWQALVVAAKQFVSQVDALDGTLQGEKIIWSQPEKTKAIKRAGKDSPIARAFQRKVDLFKQQRIVLHQLYPAAFVFDDALTLYRNACPKEGVFVVEERGSINAYTLPLQALYEMTLKNSSYFIKTSNLLQEHRQLLQNQIKIGEDSQLGIDTEEEFNQHVNQAQKAYMGAKQRILQGKNKQTSDKINLLMWKEEDKWVVADVKESFLKEAYVAVLVAKHKAECLCAIDAGNPRFYSDELISTFYYNFISKADGLAAIVEEDVYSSLMNKQYAVKGDAANLPGLKQYYRAAVDIIYTNDSGKFMSPENLSKAIHELYKNTIKEKVKLVDELNDSLIKALRDIGLEEIVAETSHSSNKKYFSSEATNIVDLLKKT